MISSESKTNPATYIDNRLDRVQAMKLQAIVILLVLIFCEKISAVDLCVRNNDYDSYCHTYFRFAPDHQFPDYFNTLLDSHSHLSLVGSKWRTLSVDGDSQDWTQRGGICQYDLRVCGFSRGEQNNWIFTHYNPYLEAKRVMVNITYRFSQCTSHPNCHNDFVNVYFYNVSSEPANHSPHTDPSSYGQPVRQLRQAGHSDNDVHWSFERPEDSVGFYLAFQDQGTCGQVRRVHIYYEIATGVRDDENLITCPCIARPFSKNVVSISNNSKPCECDRNAMPVYNLMRSVTQDGVVSKVPSCACRPGYQLEKGECLPCPPGTFKASISNTDRCTPCPLNSQSLFEASEVCACDCNKVRPKNKPEADCHSPPSNPRLAVETMSMFHEGMLKICWLPSKDDGGSPDTLHYNIYKYAQSTSEYKKVNTVGVTQSSGGINDTICYDFATESEGGVANVIVTSATKSTGDEESLKDTDEAKGRFIAIQVSTQGVVVPPGDPCTPNPCGEFATCTVQGARHHCTCTPPYEGDGIDCEIPDPCSSNPCGANEQCTQSGTGFTCDCRPPFVKVASLCVIPIPDPCSSSPCDQNARCNRLSSTSTRYTCTCTPPYTGTGFFCQLPVETTPPPQPPYFELGSTIYQDGATVSFADIAESDDALLCKTPYASCCQAPPKGEFYYPDGTLVPVRKAEQSTYRNRGAGFIRLNLRNNSPPPPAGNYACEIPDGLGQTTKIYITILHSPVTLPPPADPCLSSPCDPNAQCNRLSPTSTRYTCTCTPPFTGSGFSCQLPDPCSSNPCDPNAQCNRLSPITTRYTCTCTPPFTGSGFSCQLPDPCSSNPCGANEQCTQSGTGFTCDCRPPFVKVASLCVIPIPDPCSSSPCDPNARCNRLSSTSTRYTCTCTPPYTGTGFSCRLPAVETTPPPQPPYFELGSTIYQDGATVNFADIAEGDDALLCKTPYDSCCQAPPKGEFYYPDGTLVPVRKAEQSTYRNRGAGFIRLNLRNNNSPPPPAGSYACEIPDGLGQTTKIYITLIHASMTPPPTTTEQIIRPFFKLRGTEYEHGAQVLIRRIGEGDNALKCVTQFEACCKQETIGEFYNPQNRLVPVKAVGGPLYRNRGEGYIRLNYRGNRGIVTAGEYCCEIPDISGELTRVCINLTN